MDCHRSRTPCPYDAYPAGPLSEMVLPGNLAVRTGRVLQFTAESGEITNATNPEEYVRPPYREGWSL